MNRQVPFLLMLLILSLACGSPEPSQPPETEKPMNPLGSPIESVSPYDLEVFLDGLIAFVQDDARVWALLVDADYEPSSAQASDLPPCVMDEIPPGEDRSDFLKRTYPPHQAFIRFKNAKVTGDVIPDLEKGRPISGQDIRIHTGRTGIGTIDLTSLGSDDSVEEARRVDISRLEKIDERYLVADQNTVAAEPFLGARVLIEGGDKLEARPVPCTGGPPKFSFLAPGEDSLTVGCNPVLELAEETLLRQAGLTVPVQVELLNEGKTLTVEPARPGETVTIEIVNITQPFIDDPNAPICPGERVLRHLMTYRWFYRFSKEGPAQACSDHFSPCQGGGAAGGRKCPQKLFVE